MRRWRVSRQAHTHWNILIAKLTRCYRRVYARVKSKYVTLVAKQVSGVRKDTRYVGNKQKEKFQRNQRMTFWRRCIVVANRNLLSETSKLVRFANVAAQHVPCHVISSCLGGGSGLMGAGNPHNHDNDDTCMATSGRPAFSLARPKKYSLWKRIDAAPRCRVAPSIPSCR